MTHFCTNAVENKIDDVIIFWFPCPKKSFPQKLIKICLDFPKAKKQPNLKEQLRL